MNYFERFSEMRVAQECKEAFHELQTNINALAGSMPQGSFIPYRSYRDYIARVLFPQYKLVLNIAQMQQKLNFRSQENHPALKDLMIDKERAKSVESALRQLQRFNYQQQKVTIICDLFKAYSKSHIFAFFRQNN